MLITLKQGKIWFARLSSKDQFAEAYGETRPLTPHQSGGSVLKGGGRRAVDRG